MSLGEFRYSVFAAFEEEYLSLQTSVDVTSVDVIRIERQFAEVGFPSCVCCVDSGKWEQRARPEAHHGITVGNKKASSLRMEVVSDLDPRA